MSRIINLKRNQRLSLAQKAANDFAWYKEQADLLSVQHGSLSTDVMGGVSDYKRMKVNYDLYNNILNTKDFEYVCQPYGAEVGELPATMTNRDISSGKIKSLLGMEMKRPFSWKVLAVNPEATTRKEQAQFDEVKKFVIEQVMLPIRQEEEMKFAQQQQGKELTPEQKEQIKKQMEQSITARTPESVKKYMEREHQDPAELMVHQLLEYLMRKCKIRMKFNDGFKHALLSAKEIYYVGIQNGEPEVWNVNPLRFNYDKSPDNHFIEDGEWATCEYRMTPSEVITYFNDELTNKEIDDIYENHHHYAEKYVHDTMFSFNGHDEEDGQTVKVLHCVFKSLRKVGFLTYEDEEGEIQQMRVDETYSINKDSGDLSLDWEYIPEVYQVWKIGTDLYKRMGPVEGQFKDIDNLYHCKLPYYGAVYDAMNSSPTSLMDRLKVFQYYYNIVMYRLELVLASDKGKKIMMNINAIPDSAGIDIDKWQYFFESSPFMWFDPNEEGTGYNDVNTLAKMFDMSLVSDIAKYIELAEYLKRQAGESVGITPQIEGQVGPNDAVANTRQAIIQSSHILEPYFELHNNVKSNVIEALSEVAKIAYWGTEKKVLSYVLDDLSQKLLTLDMGLLDNTTLGIFVTNSSKAEETKETLRQLSHAAMQTGKAELSDVITVLREDSIVEIEETLKVAERNRKELDARNSEAQTKAIQEQAEKEREFKREEWQNEKAQIVLKEEERRETVLLQAALTGMSYNPDADTDGDGVNDFLEVAKHGLNADIKRSEIQLKRDELEHKKNIDKEKISVEKMKIKESRKPKNQ